MSESDLEFVERIEARRREDWRFIPEADKDRLLSLARRGAETQWRPVSEYPSDGYDHGVFARYIDGVRVFSGGFAECDLAYFSHFIPLSALGEPK